MSEIIPPVIPFTQTPPPGSWNFDDQCITGPLTFVMPTTPGGGALPGGSSYSGYLVANGVNIPTFPGMVSVSDFVPSTVFATAGTVVWTSFGYNPKTGVQTYATVPLSHFMDITSAQSLLQPWPAVASITCVHGVNPTIVITTNGAALNPEFVPDPLRFSISRAPLTPSPVAPLPCGLPVTAVEVAASSITLSLLGTVSTSDAVTLNYTSLFPGQPPFEISAQSSAGLLLAGITNASVTVS